MQPQPVPSPEPTQGMQREPTQTEMTMNADTMTPAEEGEAAARADVRTWAEAEYRRLYTAWYKLDVQSRSYDKFSSREVAEGRLRRRIELEDAMFEMHQQHPTLRKVFRQIEMED